MPFVTIDLCPIRIDVRTTEDQDAFLQLMESYRHFENHTAQANIPVAASPVVAPATMPVAVRPSMPPVGERSIDYLLRVAVRSEESQHLNALYPQMQALGWKSTSQTSRAILNNLSSVCRKHHDLVAVLHERVTLTEAGRAFAQTLPAPEATL